jgi:predicted ArsR family transcriptional regulator
MDGGRVPHAGRRQLIAELIRGSDTAVTVVEIADQLDIHPNTVRFHLDALIADGQVERVLRNPTGPGRPPQMFRARQGMLPNGPRSYRLLAEMGLSTIAADADPAATAIQVGRSWGGYLIERPAPAVTLTEEGAVHRLVDLLTDIGFAPEQRSSASGSRIGLRNCPFLELVESQTQQIICQLHYGLMRGAMAALKARTTVDRLEPFAEPGLCLAHLSSGDTP